MSTYPYAAPGRAGLTFRRTPVLPVLHMRQRPQAMLNGTEQRSPTSMYSTPGRLDHLAGDLVQDEALGGGGAAAHHVLVGAAYVRRDDLQDRSVRQLAADIRGVDAGAVLQLQRREFDVLDLDVARPS